MLELVRLVGELQPKAEAAAMWQARAIVLAERLAIAEERLLVLAAPAPQQTPEPVLGASGASKHPDPTRGAWAQISALRWRLGVLAVVIAVMVGLVLMGSWR